MVAHAQFQAGSLERPAWSQARHTIINKRVTDLQISLKNLYTRKRPKGYVNSQGESGTAEKPIYTRTAEQYATSELTANGKKSAHPG